MSEDKRKRSPNWTASEKIILLELVEKHFHIIENKKTDGVTMRQKILEWRTISDEYNSQTVYSHRTADNLKSQWESMKKATKKEAASQTMSLYKTGGGPPKPKQDDPFFKHIMRLLQPVVVPLKNKFDSIPVKYQTSEESQEHMEEAHVQVFEDPVQAGTESGATVQIVEDAQIQIIENSNISNTVVSNNDSDWGNYTPLLLQTPVTKRLKVEQKAESNKWSSKRRPEFQTKVLLEVLHKEKIDAIKAQREFAGEERIEARKLHEINLEIKSGELKIKQEELMSKKEELKQSKIKTRLLLLELRSKKKL